VQGGLFDPRRTQDEQKGQFHMFGKAQRFFCEASTKMLAGKLIPRIWFLVAVCCFFSSACPELLCGEESEPEVYTPPPGRLAKAKADLELLDFTAMKLAIEDLTKNFPDKYKNGHEYLREIDAWRQRAAEIKTRSIAAREKPPDRLMQSLLSSEKLCSQIPCLTSTSCC
jgi:hypothetical protein